MRIEQAICRTLGPIYTKERNNASGDAIRTLPTAQVRDGITLVAILTMRNRPEPITFETTQAYIDSRDPYRISYIFNCRGEVNPLNGQEFTDHSYITVPTTDIRKMEITPQFD